MRERRSSAEETEGLDGATEPREPVFSLASVAATVEQVLDSKARPMVSWFAPSQLVRTGIQVAISAALGTRVDPRRSRFPQEAGEPPIAVEPGEDGVWFDYVADVGDGYRPTWHVARAMAQPSLSPRGWRGAPLPRGQFLVLGGDLCYPTASRQHYEERLLGPYRSAWEAGATDRPVERPWVVAIPGNHDWYDGLVEFSRIFLQGSTPRPLDPVGGWRPRQRRSYFALQLPHRWWLWALDIQLESDINADQLAYFKHQAETFLREGDQVILCTAEPRWVREDDGSGALSNLEYLLRETVEKRGARIVLELAGDLHHYRHHALEGEPRAHRIICGMGGAFTHPTHNVPGGGVPDEPESTLKDGAGDWTLRRAFPSARQSRRLGRMVAWELPFRNPTFCLGLGLVHTAFAWGFPKVNVGRYVGQELVSVLTNLSETGPFFAATGAESWVLALGIPALCGYGARSQRKSTTKPGLVALGVAHGLAHVLWAAGFFLVLNQLAFWLWGPAANGLLPGIVRFGLFLGFSSLAAGLIFGLYLRLAHEVFHAHANELYSAIASPHYKGFLRVHIDGNGDLEVFPVGVGDVPLGREAADWTLLHDRGARGEPVRIPRPEPPAEEAAPVGGDPDPGTRAR